MKNLSTRVPMLAMLVVTALAAACDDKSPVANELASAPASMAIVSGDQQTGLVGQPLQKPVVVRVLDEAGAPIDGQIVNFNVTSGGGTVFAGSSLTDENGVAQEWWTLGTDPGTNQLEARAVDTRSGAKLVFATFKATGVTELPAGLQAPVSLTVTASADQAMLTWKPGDTYESQGIDRKYTSPDGSYTDPNWVRVRTLAGDATSLTDTGLGAGATYHYRVVGIAGDEQSPSEPVSVKIPSGTSTPAVASVTVSPSSVSLSAVGATQQLSATARDASGTTMTAAFTWTAANTAVATVSTSGLVTARGSGSTSVVVTAGGRADTASITVTTAAPTPPPPPSGDGSEPQPTSSSTIVFREDFERYSSPTALWANQGGAWVTSPGGDRYITAPSGCGYTGSTTGVGGRCAQIDWPYSTNEQHLPLETLQLRFPGQGKAEYFSFQYRAPNFDYGTGTYPRLGKKHFLILPNSGSPRVTSSLPGTVSLLETDGNKIDANWTTLFGYSSIWQMAHSVIADGRWHRFTYERIPESTSGAGNGRVRVWLDGVLVLALNDVHTGTGAAGLVQLASTFNGGSRKNQQEYFDNIIMWHN